MTIHSPLPDRFEPAFARDLIGPLDAQAASRIVAAGGDISLVIDAQGIIRDVAASGFPRASQGVIEAWLDQPWIEVVTEESRRKVEEMLRDAVGEGGVRWRELNHPTPQGGTIAMRYVAVKASDEGRIIAIGRDQRATAELQQRLVLAQQAMERDYAKMRDAESRYRLLFQSGKEAVIVVDAATRRIVEANPAASRLAEVDDGVLVGRAFVSLFEPATQDDALSALTMAMGEGQAESAAPVKIASRAFGLSASLYRQEKSAFFLVRLTPAEEAEGLTDAARDLLTLLERMPDAFVVADDDLNILAENAAFLRLTELASKEQARRHRLDEFLGRPDLDRNILFASVREHGAVRNFATVLRTRTGGEDNVEVSAVHAPDGERMLFGVSIRPSLREAALAPRVAGALPRPVEQLSRLVGRVTLKELVRESTDMVERLCIEAALELTGNNRASAAELLGLSRQSLYSKLHRYGLNDFAPESD
ncbi:MAG: transcriptional regulator PpsR [Hyphomonadaceae bacterium]|nr:transcriptional regulator PpsR [Hyphomonadaceae bacterium]